MSIASIFYLWHTGNEHLEWLEGGKDTYTNFAQDLILTVYCLETQKFVVTTN